MGFQQKSVTDAKLRGKRFDEKQDIYLVLKYLLKNYYKGKMTIGEPKTMCTH